MKKYLYIFLLWVVMIVLFLHCAFSKPAKSFLPRDANLWFYGVFQKEKYKDANKRAKQALEKVCLYASLNKIIIGIELGRKGNGIWFVLGSVNSLGNLNFYIQHNQDILHREFTLEDVFFTF